MGEIINFIKDEKRYRKLAEERAEKGDFFRALDFLFSAKNINPNYEVLMDIADVYADMGLLELSNKYWFLFMDKAPKERVSIAYEELAINFFYLDNYWASSFYFHKKLDTDGHISKEGLDKEIIDFFSGEEIRKNAYRLVYPFERADYSYNLKLSKHFMALGAFEEAKKYLSEIPTNARSEETSGELALAKFMSDDLDGAEKVCRESLSKDGENVTAYCHLSTVYTMKEDQENAEYYYQKALSVRKGEKSENYNIATCAIERNDHYMVKKCLEEIIKERPYELAMRFFYGVALLNLGEYKQAVIELKKVYLANPDDGIVYYYLTLAENLSSGNNTDEKLLPLKYEKELPNKIEKQYSDYIKNLADTPLKIQRELKKKSVKKTIEWGVRYGDEQVTRNAAFILSADSTKYSKNFIKLALLDTEVKEEFKRVLIYVLIASGDKEKFGVTVSNFYLKIRPKKLACEKADDGGLYLSAYALCIARIAFWENEHLDTVAKVIDKIYKKFSRIISNAEISNEELAALILSECNFKWVKSQTHVTKLFEISVEKLNRLKMLLKGEKNG